MLSFLDVEELIRKKAELETAHNFAEPVLATMREPLVVLDANMKMVMANHSFNQMFQAKPSEVLNKAITELGDSQWDNKDFKQAIKKVLYTGVATDGLIIDSVFPDSGRQIFLLNMRLLPSSSNSQKTVLITAEDITKIKQMEEQLDRYSKNLEATVNEQMEKLEEAESLAIVGQTAGMVGHDIRNPLQAIISAVYLAKDDLSSLPQDETKESLIESMKEIEVQTSYINKIVSDLQDYSRHLSPCIEEIDLRQLLESLLLSTDIDENKKMKSEISDDVQTVKVDPDFLKRILTNLITNAEQAMPNGGKITIKANKKDGVCFITVEDTGEGIPENIKNKVFTPCSQPNPKDKASA